MWIDKTKLNNWLPDSQFKLEGRQLPPFRRDRNNTGSGKTNFVKEGLIVSRIKKISQKIVCI